MESTLKLTEIKYEHLDSLKIMRIKNCSNLKNFSGVGANLQVLELINCSIDSDKAISIFRSIHNQLKVPNQLEVLDLSENKLKKFDALWIEDFINLKQLKLNNNNLEEVNFNYQFLKNLKLLDLSHNLIDLEGNPFSHLGNLETLSLHGNKKLKMKCNIFKGLIGLRHLKLGNLKDETFFSKIKKEFLNCVPKLSILELNSNSIVKIELCFIYNTLNFTNLEKLDLSDNQIDISTKTFSLFEKLIYLNLSSNRISCLCQNVFLGLKKLETLDLSKNKLKIVDQKFPISLKYLSLEDNLLENFQNFQDLILNELNICKNPIRFKKEEVFRFFKRETKIDVVLFNMFNQTSNQFCEATTIFISDKVE